MPRAPAASKIASTLVGWMVANVQTLVVPWARIKSRYRSAIMAAYSGSPNRISSGNVYVFSQSIRRLPHEAIIAVCG